MTIAAQNLAYLTQGPTATGQILAPNELSNLEQAYVGTATITLDGATTSAVVNFIDGTKTLSFIPAAMVVDIVGGTQLVATPLAATASSVTDASKGTVYLSGAGTNANTLKLLVQLYK